MNFRRKKSNDKPIKYLQGKALEKEEVKIESKIEKYQQKLENTIVTYEKLIDEKNRTGKVSIKKIIKFSKRIQKYQNEIQHLITKMELVLNRKLEKISPLKKFKLWFSRIPNNKQKVVWGIIFVTPVVLGLVIFFLPPLFRSIWWSFNTVNPDGSTLNVSFNGLENYRYLFQDYVIDGNNIFNVSLLMFVQDLAINLPIIIIFSLFIAVLLNKKFRGHSFVKAVFFIPVIYNIAVITSTMAGGMSGHLDQNLNAGVELTGRLSEFLLESGVGTGFVTIVIDAVNRIFTILNYSGIQILIFVTALQSIPPHLYEAAKVEGATKYEKFWKITIPMVTPMILTASIYTVVDSFTRAPIFRFLTYASVQSRYGLASAISVSYMAINLGIILLVFLIMKGVVFYYDE